MFLPHLEKLVADKQEHNQRCAAEIISGIIRGSKHWSYEKIQRLWTVFIPFLHTAIINMSSETLLDWGLCVDMAVDSRDPNKHHWILEYLTKDPLAEQTSFLACGRLFLLLNALRQQSWRNAELMHRLFEYLQGNLCHPFQNVREKISCCLSVILAQDVTFPGGSPTICPRVKDFFVIVMPKLNLLYTECLKKVVSANNLTQRDKDLFHIDSLDSDVQKESIRLFKTGRCCLFYRC